LVKLKPLIAKEQIVTRIAELAKEIDRNYAGRDLVIVMVLKGAICLAADLIRAMKIPCDLQSVQCSSYGARGTVRGELEIFGLERLQVTGRDVLILDDIFDSGETLFALERAIAQLKPKSLELLVLLARATKRRFDIQPNAIGFSISDEFVVGYGLDYKEHYRGLGGIFILEEP